MATKIAFLKFKGGVSSSSAVSTIAGILKNDHRVLIVDMDPQDTQKTLLNARGKAAREISMAGVLTAGYDAKKCVINICDNVDLIQSGGKAIEAFNRKNQADIDGSLRLSQSLKCLEDQYDFILLDASPTMSLIHQNIICYADYLILPCDMDILSLSATRSTVHFVESLHASLGKEGVDVGRILGVVPMRFDNRRLVDDNILEDLYSLEDNNLLCGGIVLNTVRDSSNMKTAQARRKFLSDTYPKGKLTEDYIQLTKNILNQIETLKNEPVENIAMVAKKAPELGAELR